VIAGDIALGDRWVVVGVADLPWWISRRRLTLPTLVEGCPEPMRPCTTPRATVATTWWFTTDAAFATHYTRKPSRGPCGCTLTPTLPETSIRPTAEENPLTARRFDTPGTVA
jgi:hypothetical protein